MGTCPYYNIKKETTISKEVLNDRQVTGASVTIPYCSHDNAGKFSKENLKPSLGVGNQLKCGGDRSKCPLIPPVDT